MRKAILQLLYKWLNISDKKPQKTSPFWYTVLPYSCGVLLVCITIIMAARTYVGQRQQQDEGMRLQHPVPNFPVKDNPRRQGAFVEISDRDLRRYVQNRRKVIQQLLSVVPRDLKSPSEEVREAIVMLGELRAEEATERLVDCISIVPPGTIDTRTTETVYPAVGALIRIGYPSVRTILERGFVRQRSEQEQKLMAYVTRHVLGRDAPDRWMLGTRLGRLVVEEHMRSSDLSEPVKQRLTRFMERYFSEAAKK
jgi:hypothetical protein